MKQTHCRFGLVTSLGCRSRCDRSFTLDFVYIYSNSRKTPMDEGVTLTYKHNWADLRHRSFIQRYYMFRLFTSAIIS